MKKLICAVLLCLLFAAAGCAGAARQTEIVVFKIGKADAILLISGDHAALIDTGEEEDGEEILRYLSKRGIQTLEYLIVTHFDKDHVGGASTVLRGVRVSAVYDADYESKSKPYAAYMEALQETGAPRHRVAEQASLQLGELSLTLLPTALQGAGDNDRSLAIDAKDAWNSFFFAGDAEDSRLAELIQKGLPKADLVKMPHHGRYHDNLEPFLAALGAKLAIITDSEKNPAEAETLSLLKEKGISAYRTQNGDIHVLSNSEGISVTQ